MKQVIIQTKYFQRLAPVIILHSQFRSPSNFLLLFFKLNKMKHILAVVALFIACNSAEAQLSFGSKIGSGASEQSTSSKIKKLGSSAGGFLSYQFKKNMTLRAELICSGESSSSTPKANAAKGKLGSAQLRIPVIFQRKFSKDLFTEAGMQFKSALSIRQNTNGEKSIDLHNFCKSGSIGLIFGCGYNCKHKLAGLKIGLRCNIDFPKMDGSGDLKKNFNISFTYRISKKQQSLLALKKTAKLKMA